MVEHKRCRKLPRDQACIRPPLDVEDESKEVGGELPPDPPDLGGAGLGQEGKKKNPWD